MRTIRVNPLSAIVALAALFIPTVSHAQRGAHFSVPARAMATPHRFAPASGFGASHTGRRGGGFSNGGFANSGFANNGFANNGFFSNSLGLSQISFFPNMNYGVGINGINYVATQDIGTEAAIDPATQWRLSLAQRVAGTTGVFGSGYYLLGGGGYGYPVQPSDGEEPGPAPQQQPQVIVVQQSPPQTAQTQAAPAAQAPAEAPLPDAGQFTLVLNNGAQIEAVAFTQMKDHIVYITRDGSRRTLALSDLDKEATIRINEERGTPLQLPL